MTSAALWHELPGTVSVAMSEIAEDVQDGWLAMSGGAGLQVMAAIMNADVRRCAAGRQGQPEPGRCLVRHRERVGDPGWATGVGRSAADARADGSGELPVPRLRAVLTGTRSTTHEKA